MSSDVRKNAAGEDDMTEQIDRKLDTSGLFCPEPVMLLHNQIRDMAPGDIVEVIATDPATTRDIPKFCMFLDHQLLSQSEKEGVYRYLVRKSA